MVHVLRAVLVVVFLAALPFLFQKLRKRVVGWASVYLGIGDGGISSSSPAGNDGDNGSNNALVELAAKADPTPEELGGETDRYNWTQTDYEVDVSVPVPPGTTAKSVRCTFAPTKLVLQVDGCPPLEGEFHRPVKSEECVWMLEGQGEERAVAINLIKKKRTQKNQHWRTVLRGDAEIDTTKFGPQIVPVDSTNPEAMKRMVAAMNDQ
eukprot:g385.t1